MPILYDDEYKGSRYRYGLHSRPLSPGAVPKGFIVHVVPCIHQRKTRSIKMSDAEWEEIRRRAARKDISAAEYIRQNTLKEG